MHLSGLSGCVGFGIGSNSGPWQITLDCLCCFGVAFPAGVRVQLLLRRFSRGTWRDIICHQAALIRPIEMGDVGSMIAVRNEGRGNDAGTGHVQEPQREQTVHSRGDAERGWPVLAIAGLDLSKHLGELHPFSIALDVEPLVR